MKNILIDTDVILDFFFDRKPYSNNAAIILSYCELNKLNGFITPVICSNVYYILRRTSKHEKIIERLNQLLTFIDVLQMDKEIIVEALNSKFKDLSKNIVMHNFVTSESEDDFNTKVNRTSIWRNEEEKWRMVFHQGTRQENS